MKSKISFCHKGIVKNNLSRFFPLILLYSIFWIFRLNFQLFNNITQIINNEGSNNDLLYYFKYSILSSSTSLLIILFAPLVALFIYSYLFNNRSSNLFHTFPIRRETIFISSMISGLIILTIPLIINYLIAGMIGLHFHCFSIIILLQGFFCSLGTTFVFFSLSSFIAMVTGNYIAFPFFYFIINFLAVGFEYLLRIMISLVLFGFGNSNSPLYLPQYLDSKYFSPAYYFLTSISLANSDYISLSNFKAIIGFVLFAIALNIISILLYKKRPLETSGDIIVVSWLKPIFLMGSSCGFCLITPVIAIIFLNSSYFENQTHGLLYLILLLMGGTFGFALAKGLLLKSYKIFKKGYKEYLVFICFIICFFTISHFDLFHLEANIPDINNIDSITINFDYNDFYVTLDSNFNDIIQIQNTLIRDKSAIIDSLQTNTAHIEVSQLDITYNLKNGKKMARSYPIIFASDTETSELNSTSLVTNLLNSPELESDFFSNVISEENTINNFSIEYCDDTENIYQNNDISYADYDTILSAMEKDIQSGTFKTITSDSEQYSEYNIYIYTSDINYENDYYYNFPVSSSCKNTLDTLINLGYINKNTLAKN